MALRDLRAPSTLVETALAAVICVGLAYCGWHLLTFYYLPQPFFYDPMDTYADWFNTAYWARDEGTYDVWKTIYPPLSFVILRIFGIGSCYPRGRAFESSPGLASRDCDWVGLAAIYAFFIIDVILIYHVMRKTDRRTAIQRTICLAFGFPMIDGLERGNLVLVSFMFLVLAVGPVLRSARLRWLCAGITINLKVYLLGAIFALLLKRRWRWAEGALLATVLVYLVSYAIMGRGTLPVIISNIQDFSDWDATQLLDIWYTTTNRTLISLLETSQIPTMLIGSHGVAIALAVLIGAQLAVQAMILVAAAATWLRPEAVPAYRAINLAILMALITAEAGGYSQIYFMLFVMMEPWKGPARKWAIVGCYILAIPLDIPLDYAPDAIGETYLHAARVTITYKLMIGPFTRPLIILSIAAAIALSTIADVWADIRRQGWSSRRRFHRDAPLLPWVQHPEPPAAS